ncbi:MAG TPA: hypothetical protein VFQ61_21555 [Polyangiaceae bacterium]|nr:hypothetical protein [Polyangiaceae bacterium]
MHPKTTLSIHCIGVLLALCWFPGCGRSCFSRGADLYSRGDYVDAEEYFEHTEARLGEADPQERARYALYRASTLLALGDVDRAEHWLARAKHLDRIDPGALDEDEQAMLRRAQATAAVASRRRERTQRAYTQINAVQLASP